ncbi:MAG: endonuclease MutS2 [Oscillospiraceae bacterium]
MENDILKYASQLEFDKICSLASAYAICGESRDRILALVPSTDINEVSMSLEITDALSVCVSRNSALQVSSVSDIHEITLRAQKSGILSMGELLKVRAMLKNARLLKSWFDDGFASESAAAQMFYALYEDAQLEREIGDCILSETEMSDDASAQLKDIRRRIINAESSIRDKLDSIIHSTVTQKYLQDSIVTMRGGRFVVPVKQEHRGDMKGLIHDVSSSGATYFVEPEAVVEANNRIQEMRAEEIKEIDRILRRFTDSVSCAASQIKESFNAFIDIDVALAKARYSLSINAVIPKINDSGEIVLIKARHPLIPKKNVVPIDLTLGRKFSSLIITGPNTGGKTVTLKTVGLLSLMAMGGFLIPALEGSEICVFKKVLVDIGDEQSIAQNLSTFSGHMKNIASIIGDADDESLVLLDELGAGTDPAEGAALAIAILDRLRRMSCKVVATTHYGEIKIYALETDNVQNASCEFDIKTLRPTYKLNIGIPGRSNALLIGERLGLDRELLDDARKNINTETRRFEDVLNEIENLKSEASERIELAEMRVTNAENEAKKIIAEAEKIQKTAETELKNAKQRAQQLVTDVSAGAYKLMDEIKLLDKEKDKNRKESLSRARAIANSESLSLLDLADPVEANMADHLEPLTEVKAGDRVYVAQLSQEGVALSAPDKNGSVEVKAGLIKARVNISDLRKPPEMKKKKQGRQISVNSATVTNANRTSKSEINLLGLTVEEALMEVDNYIDTALMSHLNTVYLIHGRGTGALRTAIHQHLKNKKRIKSFRLGKYGEGEDGVTVVELK